MLQWLSQVWSSLQNIDLAEIALGGIIGVLTTLWIEALRKPKLEILSHITTVAGGIGGSSYTQIDKTTGEEIGIISSLGTDAYILRLALMNKSVPHWIRWISRQVAVRCYGTITFYHLDGQNVFGSDMSIIWEEKISPVNENISKKEFIDLYPGETGIYTGTIN